MKQIASFSYRIRDEAWSLQWLVRTVYDVVLMPPD